MRNLLDTSKCAKFKPTFDNRECATYQYAEGPGMEPSFQECGYCTLPNAYRCIADVTRFIPLSHSSTGTFLTCHYLYMLQKLLGIEVRLPFFGNALKAGKLWDTIKQKHLGADVNIKATIEEYEMDLYIVAKVRALYHAYKELEITVEPGYSLQAAAKLHYDILPPSSFIPSINIGKEAINLWQDRASQSEDERRWHFPLTINGFYDRKYPNYFTEDKLSGRPEFYLDPFYIQSQNGTYFLADPNLEYCIQEVVQFPQQKELKKKEESPDQIYKRVYSDIISRPSKYFIGWNGEKKMYGKKFYRGEFNLDQIEQNYKQTVIEILSCRWTGIWQKNWKVCGNIYPGISCDFQSICKTGTMSDTMYKVRERP
jgi:hypothetical protein